MTVFSVDQTGPPRLFPPLLRHLRCPEACSADSLSLSPVPPHPFLTPVSPLSCHSLPSLLSQKHQTLIKLIVCSVKHQPVKPLSPWLTRKSPKTRPHRPRLRPRRKPKVADRRTDKHCSFYPNYLSWLRRRISEGASSDWTGVRGQVQNHQRSHHPGSDGQKTCHQALFVQEKSSFVIALIWQARQPRPTPLVTTWWHQYCF